MTRYEIVEHFKGGKDYKGGIKVKLASDKHAYIFNLHLPSHPYQPYQLLGIRPKWHKHTNNITFIKTEAETIGWAKKRGSEIGKLLRQLKSIPDKKVPILWLEILMSPPILTGRRQQPRQVAIQSKSLTHFHEMAKAGFSDSYRKIYPDEMKNPGLTWSPKYKLDDPTTHPDRIDFVYFKGKGLQVKDVKILGENEENADLVTPYPSDHRAVVALHFQRKQNEDCARIFYHRFLFMGGGSQFRRARIRPNGPCKSRRL